MNPTPTPKPEVPTPKADAFIKSKANTEYNHRYGLSQDVKYFIRTLERENAALAADLAAAKAEAEELRELLTEYFAASDELHNWPHTSVARFNNINAKVRRLFP